MKRVNYVVSPAERLTGFALPPAPDVRGAVAALAGAIVLSATLGIVQEVRFRHADRAATEIALLLAQAERDAGAVRAMRSEVEAMRVSAARIASIRRSGGAEASRIAQLGNALPADAWFSAVRADHGSFGVEGRGRGLTTVADTLTALGRLPAYGRARLISVRADTATSGVTYALALEPVR